MHERSSARTAPAAGPLLVGMIIGLLLAGLLGVFVVLPGALTHRESGPLEQRYGDALVNLVTLVHPNAAAGQAANASLDAGRAAYMASCAECHGETGRGEGVFGSATFPPATDLTSAIVKQKSDAQLAWIIQNGLGFTAMPGYGATYKPNDIAALVAYVRSLQTASA